MGLETVFDFSSPLLSYIFIGLLWVCALQPPALMLVFFVLKKNKPLSFLNKNYRLNAENIANLAVLLLCLLSLIYAFKAGHESAFILIPLFLICFQLCLFDLRYLWLPDRLTVPLIILGILFAVVSGAEFLNHIFALVAALFIFLVPRAIFNRLKGVDHS